MSKDGLPTSSLRLLVSLSVLLLAAASSAVPAGASDEAGADEGEPTRLVVGLGYIPSVQFAQFYLADQAGYYAEEGLEVTFQNKIDPELVTLLASGAVDIGMSDGTSLIPAVSQGIPIVYGLTVYGDDPNIVFTKSTSGIEVAADLAGRRIGIPGRFGSSWFMLQALLASAGLTPDDVELVFYPDFGQAVAVAEDQVDAATGFVNNEPVQLRRSGIEVRVLRGEGSASLPGPGLVVGTATLEAKGDALRGFARATLRAMQEISADPNVGLQAAFQRVPELASDPETQLAILEATIDAWMSEHAREHGLGSIDREMWRSTIDVMASLPDSVVAESLSVEQLITDALLQADGGY